MTDHEIKWFINDPDAKLPVKTETGWDFLSDRDFPIPKGVTITIPIGIDYTTIGITTQILSSGPQMLEPGNNVRLTTSINTNATEDFILKKGAILMSIKSFENKPIGKKDNYVICTDVKEKVYRLDLEVTKERNE